MAHLIGQESIWAQMLSLLDTSCHLFLTGSAGSGKTALVKSLLKHYAHAWSRPSPDIWGEETSDECLVLSPDQDRGIQTIRSHVGLFIRQMAPVSLNGAKPPPVRWVLIDDVDTFPQISQQALRRPMETYSHITRFIFVGSSVEDLIPALRSRCIHTQMNTFDLYEYGTHFLDLVQMPFREALTEGMWTWILTTSASNVGDFLKLLSLVRDILNHTKVPPTLAFIQMLCSTPFHIDFLPLLDSLNRRDVVQGTHQLIEIWKKGYTFEDILESFQTIHTLFGNGTLEENKIIHIFLINAWIAYCKGNTSILSLQNVYFKTVTGVPAGTNR
jgi:replication factor C subunit 2/4